MFASVHCSLWRFEGDPDDLERRYLELLSEVPESNHRLHAAAKTPSGFLVFDTCPSEDAYRAFFDGPGLELLAKHGLVPASSEDHPVSRAYAQGGRIDIAPS
jgi:hypothetical protein